MNKSQIKSSIDKIKKDNEVLKERIQIIRTTVPRTVKIGKKITKMNDLADQYSDKNRILKERKIELKKRLSGMSNDLVYAKRQNGGLNSTYEKKTKLQNQMRVLENRLDRILSKYNQSISENRSLREQIETLREEKVVFDGIYKGMERELEEKKKKMSESIESSNNAYDVNEESKQELERIQHEKKLVLYRFNEQFKSLDEIIEQNKRIQEVAKKRERELLARQQIQQLSEPNTPTRRNKHHNRNKSRSGSGHVSYREERSPTIMNEEDIEYTSPSFERGRSPRSDDCGPSSTIKMNKRKRGLTKLKNTLAKRKNSSVCDDDSSIDLEKFFQDIEKELNLKPNEVFQQVQEIDNNNFSLFVHSNELNGEIQNLESQIKVLKKNINSYVVGDISKEERKKNRMMLSLQKQIQESTEKVKEFEAKKVATKDVLDDILDPLKEMYMLIGCKEEVILEQRGEFGINLSNVMAFLSQIEQRIDDFINILRKEQQNKNLNIGPKTPKPLKRKRFSIHPPSSVLGEEEPEKTIKPLTREELIERLKTET